MPLELIKESKDWLKKCKPTILNPLYENPFPKPPFAVNYYNNPPLFCYGRDDNLNEIVNEINNSINHFQPILIRVMGKQGIGKSTLICWCANEINKKYSVPIIYLETSAQPDDFKMKSLYRQIISKIEKPDIINKLLFKSINKFIKIFKNASGRLYEELSNKFSGEEIKHLISNSEYIEEKIKNPIFNQKMFDLLNNNSIILKNYIPIELNFLLVFWKAHTQNPELMRSLNAFRGYDSYSGYNIQTDSDASKYIDEIIELFRWAFDEKTTLIIIIDHLEAGISHQKESVYSNLFSLLLNLRQKKFLTIILSGTLDAYGAFDEVLQEDQKLQLDNWSKTIALTSLDPNVVIEIINRYLVIFWSKFNYQPPPSKVLFPFGINSIKYLYDNNGQDLRNTLKNLYELIEKYRKDNKLELIESFFDAFKAFRQRDDVALSYIEQKELREKLLNSKIQDKYRSTMVEMALCNFFEILRNHQDYSYLSDVRHEPPLGMSNKKPDIFLEFFGNLGSELIKKLGIEVKVYRKSKEVPKKDIEKTYLLLKENALDYVTWITNVPLDLRYRYNIPDELKINLGRISPLNELELGYISFMVYFEEIFERKPAIEEIEFILNKLDLSPIKLREKLKTLPKLTKITKVPGEILDLTSFGKISRTQTTDLGKIMESSGEKPLVPLISVEIGLEQIKSVVRKYVEEKSKTNKQITLSNTIKAIHKSLNLEETDKKWDDDIWGFAVNMSKNLCVKQTIKTIYFK